MINRRLPLLLLSCIALVPATARAQERGQTGVVMGYPTTFAFIWHVSDRLAIRPEVGFAHSSTDNENSIFSVDASIDTWTATVGGSVLWYVGRVDNVRTYFSPRIAFAHNSADSSTNDDDPRTADTFAASGSFGAQYTPVRKFSVYGEIGYGFSHGWSEVTTPISTTKISGWTWSPRTSVGVIFYLGRS